MIWKIIKEKKSKTQWNRISSKFKEWIVKGNKKCMNNIMREMIDL
jgi:hypothetical protein